MPENSCIMQLWAEPSEKALPVWIYSQILYQFLAFTQNLKQSQVYTNFGIFPFVRKLNSTPAL